MDVEGRFLLSEDADASKPHRGRTAAAEDTDSSRSAALLCLLGCLLLLSPVSADLFVTSTPTLLLSRSALLAVFVA